MLERVAEKMVKQNVYIEIDNSAKNFIEKQGFDNNFGARPLRRTIQNFIEDKLAESILGGITENSNKIIISERNDEIVINAIIS